MFALRTAPQQEETIDHAAFIDNYLHGTEHNGYSGFQMNERMYELSLPSVADIEAGIGIDTQLDEAHANATDDQEVLTADWATELIVADYFPNDEASVIAYLQDDLHELFPNEKMWPHLDALAESAARDYFTQFKDAVSRQADHFVADHTH